MRKLLLSLPLLLITTASCKKEEPAKGGEPKAAEPKAAEPKAAEPKAAEPKAAEPKAAEPKAAEPKAAEPKAAEPKAAEPKAAGPTLSLPTTRLGPFDLTTSTFDLGATGLAVETGLSDSKHVEDEPASDLISITAGALRFEAGPIGGPISYLGLQTPGATTGAGLAVGDTAGTLAARLADATCEGDKYNVSCRSPRDPRIVYVLEDLADPSFGDGVAVSALAADATITEIVWMPEQPVPVVGLPSTPTSK